ncbi:hypothetical protein [Amycolatopsis sp. WGS_07]
MPPPAAAAGLSLVDPHAPSTKPQAATAAASRITFVRTASSLMTGLVG